MIWDLNSILVSESKDLSPAKGQLVIDASINQQRKRLHNKVQHKERGMQPRECIIVPPKNKHANTMITRHF